MNFYLFCHTSSSSFPGTEVCHGCPSTRLDTFNTHRCCASSHLVETSAYALIVHQFIYLFILNYPPYSDLCLASWINLSKSHGVPPTFVQGRQNCPQWGLPCSSIHFGFYNICYLFILGFRYNFNQLNAHCLTDWLKFDISHTKITKKWVGPSYALDFVINGTM